MISESLSSAKATASPSASQKSRALDSCAHAIALDPLWARALSLHRTQEDFVRELLSGAHLRGMELAPADVGTLRAMTPVPSGCRLEQWSLANREGWQPLALEFGPVGPELVWGCGVARADQVFHEMTVFELRALPLNRHFAVRTPLTPNFIAKLTEEALPIVGLIYHMSRCGSTLVAEALKAWSGMRVLSEPSLIDGAVTMGRYGHDPEGLVLRGVMSALAQPSGDDRAVCIKLDAWHTLSLVEIRRCVPAPWLFVYRDPVEVLVSHRRAPGRHVVEGLLPDFLSVGEGIPVDLTPADHAARVIGAICAAVVPHASAAQLLNYTEIPAALTRRLPATLGLNAESFDPDRLATVLTRHAKQPHEAFSDDRAAKQAEAGEVLRARAKRWIEPHYTALESMRTTSVTRIRHLKLPIECDLDALRADLAAVAPDGWSPHFNRGYYSGDWSGISLRGVLGTHVPLYADPNCCDFADTEAMKLCRYVPRLLAELKCPVESVRFLKLSAGAAVHSHRDEGLSFEEGVVRLHIPVFTHAAVEFVLDDQSLELLPGECWYLNFDLVHRAANRGDCDRVHLVIDVRVNAALEARFASAAKRADHVVEV